MKHNIIFCFSGVRVKSSGGHYVYVKESFGNRIGFTFLWAQCILVLPMGLSIAALATAEYILRPAFLDCPDLIPREGKRFIATTVLCKWDIHLIEFSITGMLKKKPYFFSND